MRRTGPGVNASPAAVLVVDDVPENRDLLVRRLQRLGINEIEQAANGLEALAAIERRNFDLVLLDIMMRGSTGSACSSGSGERPRQ